MTIKLNELAGNVLCAAWCLIVLAILLLPVAVLGKALLIFAGVVR